MSYEILVQKEEFKNYENNIIKMLKNYINEYCSKKIDANINQYRSDDHILWGKIQGIKESLMLNISKIQDEDTRKKFKEILKKKYNLVCQNCLYAKM